MTTELDLRTMLHEELESRQKARIERAEECLRQAVVDAIPRALDLMEGRETTQQVVNANPSSQSTSSGSNGSHEPQSQPAAQQRPDPFVALAAQELASAEAVDVQALHGKAEEIASSKGRDPGQVANELAARVHELREADDPSAGQQSNPSRVPGAGFVRNLFSRDDHDDRKE